MGHYEELVRKVNLRCDINAESIGRSTGGGGTNEDTFLFSALNTTSSDAYPDTSQYSQQHMPPYDQFYHVEPNGYIADPLIVRLLVRLEAFISSQENCNNMLKGLFNDLRSNSRPISEVFRGVVGSDQGAFDRPYSYRAKTGGGAGGSSGNAIFHRDAWYNPSYPMGPGHGVSHPHSHTGGGSRCDDGYYDPRPPSNSGPDPKTMRRASVRPIIDSVVEHDPSDAASDTLGLGAKDKSGVREPTYTAHESEVKAMRDEMSKMREEFQRRFEEQEERFRRERAASGGHQSKSLPKLDWQTTWMLLLVVCMLCPPAAPMLLLAAAGGSLAKGFSNAFLTDNGDKRAIQALSDELASVKSMISSSHTGPAR